MGANMWECDCGHVEYGRLPPDECSKCWQTNSFVEIPEDMIDEMKDHVLKDIKKPSKDEDEEELDDDEEDF